MSEGDLDTTLFFVSRVLWPEFSSAFKGGVLCHAHYSLVFHMKIQNPKNKVVVFALTFNLVSTAER